MIQSSEGWVTVSPVTFVETGKSYSKDAAYVNYCDLLHLMNFPVFFTQAVSLRNL